MSPSFMDGLYDMLGMQYCKHSLKSNVSKIQSTIVLDHAFQAFWKIERVLTSNGFRGCDWMMVTPALNPEQVGRDGEVASVWVSLIF